MSATDDPKPRRSLFRGISWIGSYTGLFMAIRMVRGAVIPKILPPGPYGLWSSITVVQRYLMFADLGVLAQYRKRFPRMMGQGREEQAGELEARTMGLVTVAAVLVFVGLATAALLIQSHQQFYRPALLLVGFSVLLQRTRLSTTTAMTVREQFRLSSITSTVYTVTDMVAAICLAWLLGAVGLPAGLLTGEVVTFLFLLMVFRPPRPMLPNRAFLGAVREGLLLLALQLSAEFLFTADRIMLVSMGSSRELGLYSLSMFGIALLMAPSGIFLTVLQPRMMHMVGAGQQLEARKLLEAGLSLYLLVTIAAVICALPGAALLLEHYFISYAPGKRAAFILFSLALIRGPLLILQIHYLAANREKVLVTFNLIFGALVCLLAGIALRQGLSIEGVAGAAVVAQSLFAVTLWIDFERKAAGGYVGVTKYLIMIGGLLMYAALGWSLWELSPSPSFVSDAWQSLSRAALALVLLAAACALCRRRIWQLASPFMRASK